MNQTRTAFHRRLVGYIEIGLFAALIYFAITYLKIQMPGRTMVHAGNALVVLSVLLLGFKRGSIASFLGLFIFVLNGFAASVAFTLLEAALVLVTVNAVYTYVFKKRDTRFNLVAVSIVAGLVKIVSRPVSIVAQQLVLGSSWNVAMATVVEKMPATFFTAIVTAILVGILYYPMKRAIERFHPIGQ